MAATEPSKKVKRTCYTRDEECCVRCGASLWTVPGSLHHRKPRSVCGRVEKHTVPNLILLCGSGTTGCHGWVHAHPAEANTHGWCLHEWQDPSTVPVQTVQHGLVILNPDGTTTTQEVTF